jgi:NTE family protein
MCLNDWHRMTKSHVALERPPFDCIALVLQGGGALGSYQAGVYQALAEAKLEPDWIAGISIGAINAALIAGNPPETRVDKLRAFWEGITAPAGLSVLDLMQNYWQGEQARMFFNQLKACGAVMQGTPGFFQPRVPSPFFSPAGTIGATSYYDTTQLRGTLESLIDFDYLNAGKMRFSAGSVNVRSGNFVHFDSTTRTIKVEHILASGALPPGFPAIEIDGELFWDGGLVSNTPLEWITTGGETDERRDTLAFQVDLWSSRGEAPGDMSEVITRQKEIQYSSRTRYNTDSFKRIQTIRRALAHFCDQLPPEFGNTEEGKLLHSFGDRKVFSVVHLIYRSKNYEKRDHWTAGYNDTVRSLRYPEALQRPTDITGVATFDVGARD